MTDWKRFGMKHFSCKRSTYLAKCWVFAFYWLLSSQGLCFPFQKPFQVPPVLWFSLFHRLHSLWRQMTVLGSVAPCRIHRLMRRLVTRLFAAWFTLWFRIRIFLAGWAASPRRLGRPHWGHGCQRLRWSAPNTQRAGGRTGGQYSSCTRRSSAATQTQLQCWENFITEKLRFQPHNH